MKRKVKMILLSCGVVAAAGIVYQMFTPRNARAAATACTAANVAGTYGFQFAATYGPNPQNPSQATVPFAELGTFVVDANGNTSGASDASYGGMVYHQTFSGNVTYFGDCTAEVKGMNHTLNSRYTLRWVIVHPGEEMLLFSMEPGTVGPGKAQRIGAESQLDRIEGMLRDIGRTLGLAPRS